MSKFWSPLVSSLVPYVPGEQPKMANLVKLNTNENPFGPSPKVIEAIRAELNDSLRLYPDPEGEDLRQTIAGYHSVKPEQIFLGNGSDEVLAHIFYALFQHGQPVLFPDVTYSFYPVYCGLYNIEGKRYPSPAVSKSTRKITGSPMAESSSQTLTRQLAVILGLST